MLKNLVDQEVVNNLKIKKLWDKEFFYYLNLFQKKNLKDNLNNKVVWQIFNKNLNNLKKMMMKMLKIKKKLKQHLNN